MSEALVGDSYCENKITVISRLRRVHVRGNKPKGQRILYHIFAFLKALVYRIAEIIVLLLSELT